MTRQNVLVLTPWYPTHKHRYSGVFVREYAKAVQDRWNAIVLHAGVTDASIPGWWAAQKETDEELTDGVPSYRAAYRRTRVRGCNWPRYWCGIFQTVRDIAKEHGRPDIVHAHVYTTGQAALRIGKFYGIPVVISEHYTAFARGLLSPRQLAKARRVFGKADVVLPVSEALQHTLEQLGVVASFRVVPNIINTDRFYYRQLERADVGVARLLAVSSLVEHKGLRILFRVLAEASRQGRPWHLDVVGDGPEAAEHRQMVDELGLASKVTFYGQLFKKDVAAMMSKADLFVLPSLVETFSVATAEALASGLPVLVTKCGGPEEFVTERSGMIVPPGDAPALAGALDTMLGRLDTYDRQAIAASARERFGYQTVGNTLNDIYFHVLGLRQADAKTSGPRCSS